MSNMNMFTDDLKSRKFYEIYGIITIFIVRLLVNDIENHY